jgi:3-methyl-2-oxobutanoate hydroxymethyltransferase
MGRVTTHTIRKMKGKAQVVCTTAYDAAFAALADQAGVDLILIGDSLGTTLLGFSTTVPVTMDMMVHHTAAVSRAKPNALVVLDVPFGVASHSFDFVLDACVRAMQEGGADAVKIEGGAELAPTVKGLIQAGVPVLGHIGLLPQRVNQLGGYRRFGKTPEEIEQLVRDAQAIEAAGAFALVGESIVHEAAGAVAASVKIPLIGIGSGPHCDGQILVSTDLLGLTQGNVPSFAKRYADLGTLAREAFSNYAKEVREGAFPVENKQP